LFIIICIESNAPGLQIPRVLQWRNLEHNTKFEKRNNIDRMAAK